MIWLWLIVSITLSACNLMIRWVGFDLLQLDKKIAIFCFHNYAMQNCWLCRQKVHNNILLLCSLSSQQGSKSFLLKMLFSFSKRNLSNILILKRTLLYSIRILRYHMTSQTKMFGHPDFIVVLFWFAGETLLHCSSVLSIWQSKKNSTFWYSNTSIDSHFNVYISTT